MKRFLCVMLAAVLFLSLCSSASAAEYAHPVAGFHFTVPEGWMAIDSANIEEVMGSGRLSADMTTVVASIRGILDSTLSVYLFKEDVAQPPFVNVCVEDKGAVEEEITPDDLLTIIRGYEAHYLETLPGYTILVPAGIGQLGGYPMGHLSGGYEQGGYRIALSQAFVVTDARFYEITLTAEEGEAAAAMADFGDLVASFAAPAGLAKSEAYPQLAKETEPFVFGEDMLDSVTAIVGFRECTGSDSGSGMGYEQQAFNYKSPSVRDDLIAYTDHLIGMGFEVVQGAPLDVPGSGVLVGQSASPGAKLQVDLSWTEADYRISVTKKIPVAGGDNPETDPGLLARGQALLDAEAYEEALALFDEAAAESGDAAECHYYRGLALAHLLRDEEAERAFSNAVRIDPENARYLDEYGSSMIYTGKVQDAYEAIDKAVTLEPLNGEYRGDRGFVLFLLNRPDEALADLEQAIQLAPDYANAYYFAAIIQQERGALEEVASHCEAYLARVPIADEVWLMLGDARMEQGRYTEALAAYDGAVANGYYVASDIANYAEAKEKAGEAGIEAADQGSDQGDSDLLARVEELLDADSYEEALALMDEAIMRRPGVAGYHHSRGGALFGLERFKESLESINEAIRLDGSDGEYYRDRGVAYVHISEYEAALADFLKAKDLNYSDEAMHFFTALCHAELEELAEAVQACANGLAEYPDSGDIWGFLGHVQINLENYSEAFTAYNRAIATGDYTAEDFGEAYTLLKDAFGGVEETLTVTIDVSLMSWLSEEEAKAQAEERGIDFAVNRDGSFTYTMTPDQQTQLWANWMKDVPGTVLQLLKTDSGVRNCEMDTGFTEITFYVEADIDRDWLETVPALMGLRMAASHALQGKESPSTLVRIVDADTGTGIDTFRVPGGR
ncbi:MAG: tetratricopeptide repeat protein [Clostridia bacterium]|nr:tetratricopeptide repeat protein [Clostridia bacterium]